jgi:hypothetical protein
MIFAHMKVKLAKKLNQGTLTEWEGSVQLTSLHQHV